MAQRCTVQQSSCLPVKLCIAIIAQEIWDSFQKPAFSLLQKDMRVPEVSKRRSFT